MCGFVWFCVVVQVKTIIDTVHGYGGQVYMDGANMNAPVRRRKTNSSTVPL